MAKLVDGEAFKFSYTNNRLKHPIKLDGWLVEADQVTTEAIGLQNLKALEITEVDGIKFSPHYDPLAYFLLEYHPGSVFGSLLLNKGNWVNSKFVRHWFRQDRGWLRGIPEFTTSLPLCSLLRRYTLAVIKAAEVAADFAAVLESEAPPNASQWGSGPVEDDPFESVSDRAWDVYNAAVGLQAVSASRRATRCYLRYVCQRSPS